MPHKKGLHHAGGINMPRKALYIAAGLLLGCFSGWARAQMVIVQVNGLVTGSTCYVALEGSTNPVVVLPKVAASQLNSAGKTAGETKITLEMTGCNLTDNQRVVPYFSPGGNLNDSGERLKNVAVNGAAVNVELELLHQGKAINLGNSAGNQGAGSVVVREAGGSATIEYAVRYYATGQAEPGNVHSSMLWEVQYN